ncbi:hypothetical protein BH23GEM6_BH23GEM6_18030 [soil metagenome]
MNWLQSYLYFGAAYGDLATEGALLLAGVECSDQRRWAATASEQQLVRRGVECLRRVAREALSGNDGGTNAVQLSGGFDSRAVLGALLDNVDSAQVVAVTWGTPGSPDYEVPVKLTRFAGIRHERFDATSVEWNAESIVCFVRAELSRLPAPTVIERYIVYSARRRLGTDPVFWSGFLGGTTAGSHLPEKPSEDWNRAVDHFLAHNRESRSCSLESPGWDPRSVLPHQPIVDPSCVGIDDQLGFAGRQSFRIASPWSAFREQHLFGQPAWMSFMLSVPHVHRNRSMRLYRRILYEAYPKLFKFPIQGNYGLPGNASTPRRFISRVVHRSRRRFERITGSISTVADVQKIDYARAFRSKTDYAKLHHSLLMDLASRNLVPHLDIEGIWNDHVSGRANHARAVRVLTSLEVNLRAMAE